MLSSFFECMLLHVVFVLKLLNTAAPVDEFLLTCKERMASRAHIQSQLFFRRFGHKRISTCASNFTFLIIGMDSFLHVVASFPAQALLSTISLRYFFHSLFTIS